MPGVILDTGPLVALFGARESHHPWAVEQFKQITTVPLTCEPVIAETCHLLARRRIPPRLLLDRLHRGELSIGLSLERESAAVMALMDRYDNVPMSLADACLVRMAELFPRYRICTLDSDFLVYRKHGREPIDLLTPPFH